MAAIVTKGPKAWGDDDGEDDDRETQDSNGIVERVKFSVNNKGQKIKTVTKVRVAEVKVKTPKRADLRRNLPRFGDAKIGEENVTLPSRDFVSMEHPDDQLVEDVDDPSLAKTLANFIMKRQETKAARELGDDEDYDRNAIQEKKDSTEGGKSDRYVPPGAKGAGTSSSGGLSSLEKLASTADTTTIRVSNLTKAVTEDDVHDLFNQFGRISRVSVPRLAGTKEPRGFAYVTFYSRDDAEKAMDTLQVSNIYTQNKNHLYFSPYNNTLFVYSRHQGHGYDHLILKLEWAIPTVRDPSQSGGLSSSYVSGYGQKLAQDTKVIMPMIIFHLSILALHFY